MHAVVLFEDQDVIPHLHRLPLPKDILAEIIDRAVGERANVNDNDPAGTRGLEMRRWLVRFLREDPRLKELGWVPCAHDQMEGIRHDEGRVKIVPLNTDAKTGMPEKQPCSVTEKGPAAERRIQANEECRQIGLFDSEVEAKADPISEYEFLYLCIYVSEKHIAVELSRPSGMTDSFVDQFSHRVILYRPGDKPGLRRVGDVEEDFAEVEKPTLTRKD